MGRSSKTAADRRGNEEMKCRIFAILLIAIMLVAGCKDTAPMPDSSDAGDYAPPYEAEVAPGGSDYRYRETSDWANRGESYLAIKENERIPTERESMATISLKVDTAAYDNITRYINDGMQPPKDAVRTEELINYFSYEGELQPEYGSPFAISVEIAPSPLVSNTYMAFVRIKTKEVDKSLLPPSNLVFLIDSSGSMASYDKLPLLQQAFGLLTETLNENDRISIVTYAGSSAVVLDGVSGSEQSKIINAINELRASGSTAGAKGIQTAYEIAERNFIEGGNNRVILASDGDFNVGISNINDLKQFISDKRDSGIYLSVLGFGTGNLQDATMETLAANGNGNYSYINSISGAEKVLVDEMAANLFTVADDVKAQIEFNPQWVKSYRLIGYENRQLANEDFRNDTVDAGEVGVGTDVVAMFELELYTSPAANADLYKYREEEVAPATTATGAYADEICEVRIRYKDPGESSAQEIVRSVTSAQLRTAENSSHDFRFACAVAYFGDLLRGTSFAEGIRLEDIQTLAWGNKGQDPKGYRKAFWDLLAAYEKLN